MITEDIFNDFKKSKEYKAWKKSFSKILQYIKEGPYDEEYIDKLFDNHFTASLMLYKGLEKAKENIQKKEKD